MKAEWKLLWLTAILLVLTQACTGVADDPELPEWARQAPRGGLEVTAGERVWALVPEEAGTARFSTFTVESVAGRSVSLTDSLGNRFPAVPAAFVYPLEQLAPEGDPSPGSLVLADLWNDEKVMARWRGRDGESHLVTYDHNGETVETSAAVVVPLPAARPPLFEGFVFDTEGTGRRWGLCFAASESQLWLLDELSRVHLVPRESARQASPAAGELAPGDSVLAYSWSQGVVDGRVTEVLEPGVRYQVSLPGGGARSFPFDRLLPVP